MFAYLRGRQAHISPHAKRAQSCSRSRLVTHPAASSWCAEPLSSAALPRPIVQFNLKENYINKQFEHDKQSYATLKQELDAVERSFNESTENVNKLTNELGGIAEQLDEMKGTMADRGNSMTDTSPLVQIKQALKQIKQEVVTFDLQIGVAGHALMQQKLKRGAPTKDEPAAKAIAELYSPPRVTAELKAYQRRCPGRASSPGPPSTSARTSTAWRTTR